MDYLGKNRAQLYPDLAGRWAAAGGRTAGTWEGVFGAGPATDEIFMAWHYGRYMERMTAAGKAEYPLPVFTNTWIVQPEDKGPGDYPSGGPEPLTIDIWKAGAPSIDLNAPDIYLPNFADWVGWFHRPDNPLFVPESRGDAAGVANAFYTIGRHAGIGYSPFGIDDTSRLVALRPGPDIGAPAAKDLENLPLAKGYALLRQMAPLILDAQARGTIAAVSLTAEKQTEAVPLGDYTVNFEVRRNRRNPAQVPAPGYALVVAAGPGEYFVAGSDIQVTFTPRTPGPEIAGLATVEAGRFESGRWIAEPPTQRRRHTAGLRPRWRRGQEPVGQRPALRSRRPDRPARNTLPLPLSLVARGWPCESRTHGSAPRLAWAYPSCWHRRRPPRSAGAFRPRSESCPIP